MPLLSSLTLFIYNCQGITDEGLKLLGANISKAVGLTTLKLDF
jgi:hypothetical protein